jgi:hypothetical protein
MPSYTQNPIPQVSFTTPEQHHRFINLSIIAVAIVLVFGILYWWTTSGNGINSTTGPTQSDLRTEVAAMLQSSQPASAEKISAVSSLISNSKATTSAEKRQNIANALNGK